MGRTIGSKMSERVGGHTHRRIRVTAMLAASAALALALSACGGSGGSAAATVGGGGSSAPATTPATTAVPSGSGVVPAVDPCQLVPPDEASRLAGASFGPGVEQQESDTKQCVYGAQMTNVVTVSVIQAASEAQAQAAKQQLLADIQQQAHGAFTVTQMPDFADGAVEGRASVPVNGTTFAASAIIVLKGTIAFGFSDLVFGHDAPSNGSLEGEATTVLTRLP
jgi:hypothetical protein